VSDPAYSMGQAVFIRTDTPELIEVSVPFMSLEEMVQVCVRPRPDMVLDRLIVYSMPEGVPVALTLGFVAATTGQRPGATDAVPDH